MNAMFLAHTVASDFCLFETLSLSASPLVPALGWA